MKKTTLIISFIACMMLFTSCAKKVVTPFQASSDNTGSIKIKPSRAVHAASVTIDGNLVWDRKRTVKSVTITNVPKGNHEINMVSDSWYYKDALEHKEAIGVKGAGETKTVLVSVPPYSTGYYIYCIGIMLICVGGAVAGI